MTHIQHTPNLLSNLIPSIFTKPPVFSNQNFSEKSRLSQQPAIPFSPWPTCESGFNDAEYCSGRTKYQMVKASGTFGPLFFHTKKMDDGTGEKHPRKIGT